MKTLKTLEGTMRRDRRSGSVLMLPALAAELVQLKIDIFVVHGTMATQVANKATRTIPIVFPVAADPVGTGLIASLARPGGNLTGLSDFHGALAPKRLELLKEMAPSASRIAVLWNPDSASNVRQLRDLQAAASTLGVSLLPLAVKKPEDLERAFAAMRRESPDALNIFGNFLIDPASTRTSDRPARCSPGRRRHQLARRRDR